MIISEWEGRIDATIVHRLLVNLSYHAQKCHHSFQIAWAHFQMRLEDPVHNCKLEMAISMSEEHYIVNEAFRKQTSTDRAKLLFFEARSGRLLFDFYFIIRIL